MTGAACK